MTEKLLAKFTIRNIPITLTKKNNYGCMVAKKLSQKGNTYALPFLKAPLPKTIQSIKEQLLEQKEQQNLKTIEGKIEVKFLFYREKDLADLSNMYQIYEDCLQSKQVEVRRGKDKIKIPLAIIKNDAQIESHDGSRKLIDKKDPRIEIYIYEFN